MNEDIKNYYESLPHLINEGHFYEVCIGYLFYRLEQAYHRILYCGLMKLHQTEKNLTDTALQSWRITREDFEHKIENIFGKKLPNSIKLKKNYAEDIRDKSLHGKTASDEEKRKAICDILEYSQELNQFIFDKGGFNPFGKLQGFKGAASPLSKSSTRWILKGIGFQLQ